VHLVGFIIRNYISLFVNILEPIKVHSFFSTDGVCGVKNCKYTCSSFLCCVYGLVSLRSWLFLWFLFCRLV
jgi:hypothetical protein